MVKMIQPARLGDIILTLPIAEWYVKRGTRITWPVHPRYLDLFKHVEYATPYLLSEGEVESSGIHAYECLADIDPIDILIGFRGTGHNREDWINSGMQWDEWKYHKAEVPFSERFSLTLRRDWENERLLRDMACPRGPYVITHSVGSRQRHDFDVQNAVEVHPLLGFTIVDWITVIEGAEHVYCVDSSVFHLVNQMGIAKGRRTVKLWEYPSPLLRPTIGEDWTISS